MATARDACNIFNKLLGNDPNTEVSTTTISSNNIRQLYSHTDTYERCNLSVLYLHQGICKIRSNRFIQTYDYILHQYVVGDDIGKQLKTVWAYIG